MDVQLATSFQWNRCDTAIFDVDLNVDVIGRTIEISAIHYADRLVYRLNQSINVPGVDPAFYRPALGRGAWRSGAIAGASDGHEDA